MKRTEAARAGAAKLIEAEAALDVALAHTAQLLGLLPTLRQNIGLSTIVGQEAVDALGETLTHLVSARRTLIQAHGGLQIARVQIGCGAVSIGTPDKPGQGDGPR
ncbi:hypothetical protein LTR94_025769, partial [Friedmanniomyces endolithicus]